MPLKAEYVAQELERASTAGAPEADTLVSDLIDNRKVDGVKALFRTVASLKHVRDRSRLPPEPAEFSAAGHGLVGEADGGLLGDAVASSAFREREHAAVTQGQDDRPRMHQELGDNR
ncbi:hypothetical protein ACIOKD_10810 [Streptomyces sp. NPDC087844]|uniref:hypothetical protein n=1 Tax=Streptomyces sp. NPDC087844 TaxID=3365805 RepID=UPI0037FF8F13